jgi:hypothetical protein
MRGTVGMFIVIVLVALAVGGTVKVFWPKKVTSVAEPWRNDPIVKPNCAPDDPKWKCDSLVDKK